MHECMELMRSSLDFISEQIMSAANKISSATRSTQKSRVNWSVANYFASSEKDCVKKLKHRGSSWTSASENIRSTTQHAKKILKRTHSWKPSRNSDSSAKTSNHFTKFVIYVTLVCFITNAHDGAEAQEYGHTDSSSTTGGPAPAISESNPQPSAAATCFGGLQTFEKISMSAFENPSPGGTSSSSGSTFGSGVLVQQDDQALTSECVNLCRSQSNCLSFVIDYNKFECKSYATTQQELQQEFDNKFQTAKGGANSTSNGTDYQASASYVHFQHLLPSSSSNYFEKICLDGVANRNQFSDVCGQGRLWTIERVVDSYLDGHVEKEVTNVNNKDECSKLCIFETQFVCRSADYDQLSRLCRLSKEDRRTQPQALRYVPGSNRHYLENQCATPGPSSCIYETKKNVGIISMDALKFAQTVQDCQMKCNQELTFNCRSYSFHQQRCFLSGDDSSSLNSNMIKLPMKQGWLFGEKKCLVELCSKGVFSYEKITGFTLRSALSTPIDLMIPSSSSLSAATSIRQIDDHDKLHPESSQTRLRGSLPNFHMGSVNSTSNIVSTMMMMAANGNALFQNDPMHEAASSPSRHQRSANNLAITDHCRHSCDLGNLDCPAFTVDYTNNRCQRLDRNSQGRNHELVAREGFAYYEKVCLRVPEIMSMCQDKYWIFERVIGYELAPRLYEKSVKFVHSRRDCEEYCLEEKQFQCRSALFNEETSDCKLSRLDRRLASMDGGYYRNFNIRISYLENQCIRDHAIEQKHCHYEQARDEPAYPTFTEHIEMVPIPKVIEMEGGRQHQSSVNDHNTTITNRVGPSYCEQLCNDNARFECHSFGYYASTAQCFLSSDDTISAGESSTTPSTGFVYFEKRCKLSGAPNNLNNQTANEEGGRGERATMRPQAVNPYLQHSQVTIVDPNDSIRPTVTNNNISVVIDQHMDYDRPQVRPVNDMSTNPSSLMDANQYKCGHGHTFAYQRISGFEPIGGYLTLLLKNNDQPGMVSECSDLCKRAFECRAFIVDYNNNQCYAMLENSSVGMLSLRQSLGKDYFEGFCVSDHLLLSGHNCRNKTWIMDKIVDQAVIGVQHQKIISDVDRVQCRQACLEERLFFCKSAMYDAATNECKLYSIDRESTPQMRLLFTKGVDFYENQCQINSNLCPYDAIERDMTIITTTKSVQARSTFDCESSCNTEVSFNCRSYTYLDKYPSLPNVCLLSSDSRSTSQKGSVRNHPRTLYAERNCYYRRPRNPGGSHATDVGYSQATPAVGGNAIMMDPYMQQHTSGSLGNVQNSGHSTILEKYGGSSSIGSDVETNGGGSPIDIITSLGQGCEPHQYTFERTFGFDYRLGQKERASIAPTIGISVACQQECLRRGDMCQSFVVEYALPYQSCFLIGTQVGANKKLLVKSPNSAYFEKVCLPRTGILDPEPVKLGHLYSSNSNSAIDSQSMDISPSYSSEPWEPQPSNQSPYHIRQQQLAKNYPSRSCAKLWTYERFVNHNFTVTSDRVVENSLTRSQCETQCLNEANFSCRAATYDYIRKVCRLFKNTRRTIMSQFVNLELSTTATETATEISSSISGASYPGSAHVIVNDADSLQVASSNSPDRRQSARQLAPSVSTPQPTAESTTPEINIDYLENTCAPEPSSCQYRQFYDQFSPYIDKLTHAISLSDCQRQCDLERLFGCKSINYDPATRNCMLLNEDLISLDRGQQGSLIPKKGTIYSEKGNCELISVQCNSQEMLVSINFDSPFRGRVMAKGNPEQCYLIGDGQTSVQFPIVFGPRCNSRQEGHNTFVNEVVIQQHPVIMTDSDKTVRVMCAFEAPDQTITLKNPTSRDNKTGIDVGSPDSSRTRHDKTPFNSVVSNKASPPSVLLRILDPAGRDASMINLGDDLILRIQMQMDGQNSALGIFARNLAARSSNGESLLLIDSDGCPVDPQVFPALEVDPKDGKSLHSTFKAFRFPSSGLVNFEVQIRFCPERCQPVDCLKGKLKSYGRRKREANPRTSIIQSISASSGIEKNPLDALSTVMKPGKAFQYVRELMSINKDSEIRPELATSEPSASNNNGSNEAKELNQGQSEQLYHEKTLSNSPMYSSSGQPSEEFDSQISPKDEPDFTVTKPSSPMEFPAPSDPVRIQSEAEGESENTPVSHDMQANSMPQALDKSILMHVDERVLPQAAHSSSGRKHSQAPYGRFPATEINLHQSVPGPAPIISEDRSNFSIEDAYGPTEPTTSAAVGFKVDSSDVRITANEERQQSVHGPKISQNQNTSMQNPIKRGSETSNKDLPLRFSILVGDSQPISSNGWVPTAQPPVLIMNSTNVDPDHIVVPGRGGHLGNSGDSGKPGTNFLTSSGTEETFSTHGPSGENNPISQPVDQNIDTSASNSVTAEVQINHETSTLENDQHQARGLKQIQPLESAASHDCQMDSSRSRLRTIIWTGSIVIALNVCLVILSLALYFKKLHLRKNHSISRAAASECGTQDSNGRFRWPSVLLKSKNNLGSTSMNTHEHFFCKLNSKPGTAQVSSSIGNTNDYNWLQYSASSSHSTLSSVASPLSRATNVRVNRHKFDKPLPFDSHSSLRGGNFDIHNDGNNHKSVLEINSYINQASDTHAAYHNNIDEINPERFHVLR